MRPIARVIAFYLPQFHPIPENDEWWGKGFTEWTNVTKAKPLYKGHHQPNPPGDLGFYDLRVPEIREAQAELAQRHGIEGFCYWHYWFSGKRLLERPFNEVLQSGKPEFPFCLAWANATWTGIWHGSPDRILIKQEYPGVQDYEAHFYSLLEAFSDSRYITVDGKPVFVVFHPMEFPNVLQFTDTCINLALKNGLKGLYLVGIAPYMWTPQQHGYDACCVDYFSYVRRTLDTIYQNRLTRKLGKWLKPVTHLPDIYDYKDVIRHAFHAAEYMPYQHPCIFPNWDNTPRSNHNGVVFERSVPKLFKKHLQLSLKLICSHPPEKKLIFIKSWNEWAEGNYLEPDQKYGNGYLEAVEKVVNAAAGSY